MTRITTQHNTTQPRAAQSLANSTEVRIAEQVRASPANSTEVRIRSFNASYNYVLFCRTQIMVLCARSMLSFVKMALIAAWTRWWFSLLPYPE